VENEDEGVIKGPLLVCHLLEEAESRWEGDRSVCEDDGEDGGIGGCGRADVTFMSRGSPCTKGDVECEQDYSGHPVHERLDIHDKGGETIKRAARCAVALVDRRIIYQPEIAEFVALRLLAIWISCGMYEAGTSRQTKLKSYIQS
jgi:hypothetical protein